LNLRGIETPQTGKETTDGFMTEEKKEINTLDMAREIALFIEEKFGEDIVLMDVREQVYFTDYFIIATAASQRQLQSLGNDLVREVRAEFGLHTKPEGNSANGWVLVDFGDIVVHLFSEEQREFYALEELWQEGQVLLRIQ
jgi:ribosome-associated protein